MTDRKQLGTIFVDAGVITVKTLERALERQKGSGKRLGVIFEEMGVTTEEELVDALAQQFGFKTVANFAAQSFTYDNLGLVHEDMALLKLIFPLQQKNGMLALAMADPLDFESLELVAQKNRLKIVPFLATRQDIIAAISKHYLGGKSLQGGKLKILLVDDSEAIVSIIQAALIKAGYAVVVAHDGLEGLKMAISEQPDLIICDAVMPRMDGYALKTAVLRIPKTAAIPMILLTSKASGEEEQKALEFGFFDFISKPVQPVRVISRVKSAFAIVGSKRNNHQTV